MSPPPNQRAGPAKPWWWSAGAIVIALVIYVARYSSSRDAPVPATRPVHTGADDKPTGAASTLAALIRDHRSGVVVESTGVIAKVLPDDNEGDRHQRFLVDLPDGGRVLIAHNIDLAPRAPVREGNPVRFRGEFEWNERGGVVHWTHHATSGRHEPGWIEINDKRYQ